jgi:hypothetical protein
MQGCKFKAEEVLQKFWIGALLSSRSLSLAVRP